MDPQALEILDGYPSGSAEDWRKRYAPFVARSTRHREVSSPKMSAVVVAWHSAPAVLGCIDALRGQRGAAEGALEVILVDNGGLDSIRAELASRVDVEIEMKCNVNPSSARNLGLAEARAPLIAFIDDDGHVEADFVERALAYFERPDLIAIRGRVVFKDHRYFTTLASHYDRGPNPVEDCLITEGNAVIRRDAMLAVGGFDETLMGHEGIELTFRLKQHAPEAEILYAPDVVLRHDYFNSWRKFLKKNFRYAGVDNRVAERDPALARFMSEHFGAQFPKRRLSLDESAARLALQGARTLLRIGARCIPSRPR